MTIEIDLNVFIQWCWKKNWGVIPGEAPKYKSVILEN